MIQHVVLSKRSAKDLLKVPRHIMQKFYFWVESVQKMGVDEVRKYKGFHDEPLIGIRMGQRSIRLSRSYRAIYSVRSDKMECIEVLEVNKHEY